LSGDTAAISLKSATERTAMRQGEMYSVEVEDKEVVVRLKDGLVDRDALSKLLDYLELESIRKRSQLTETQAAELAEEVNRGLWESVKHRLVEV
jgi:hypothetical protein